MSDEATGLLDRAVVPGTLALMAAHASHGSTLLEVFERFHEVANVLDQSLAHAIEINGRHVSYSVQRRRGRLVVNELAIETALVVLHRFVSWMGGLRIPINAVVVDYSPPEQAASYRQLFIRAPVEFGGTVNRMTMPRVALDRAVRRTEAQAVRWAQRCPVDAFLPLESIDGLPLQVSSIVEKTLLEAGQVADMAQVAAKLRLPPHELRRRLKAEGASFRHIRDHAKRDVAIRLLTTTELSIEEIGHRAGFSAASAFVRAFSAWTGLSPGAFRSASHPR